MMTRKFGVSDLIQANIAALLLGGTGVFAKVMPLPALSIVLGRALVAWAVLMIFLKFSKADFPRLSRRQTTIILGQGLLLATYWGAFMHAVQISSMTVALVALFTFPLFTSLIEMCLFKDPPAPQQLISGAIVILALWFITPTFDPSDSIFQGVLWGLVSATSFSLRMVLGRKTIQIASSTHILALECGVTALVLAPFGFASLSAASSTDLLTLVLLGTVFTAFAHGLLISSLKTQSASTISLILSGEPLYGILLATLFLGEQPTPSMVIGTVLILAVVISENISASPNPKAKY
ncbi:MAG: drug/metabolite transporter (DMT)-like permease [Candidatus Marinamargulisbacteria bacterium]|jgi:drug/metabolite transporter (DMT)-like permease